MRRRNVVILFVIALVFVSLPLKAQNIADIIRENRERLVSIKDVAEQLHKFEGFLYTFEGFEDELDPMQVPWGRREGPSHSVSVADAFSDIDFLFQLLKFGYAGYGYFGGDETFGLAQEQIIADISELSSETVHINRFSDILQRKLGFIQDGHFYLHNKRLVQSYSVFMNEDMEFWQDESGFYTIDSGTRKYVVSIDGNEPEGYMKVSLTDHGELVYKLTCLLPESEETLTLHIDYGSRTEILPLRRLKTGRRPDNPIVYDQNRVSGIPVIVNQTLMSTDKRDQLEQFVADAAALRGEDVVILDIRGNSGGSDLYSQSWVKNFTGQDPRVGVFYADLATKTSYGAMLSVLESLGMEQMRPVLEERFAPTDTGWGQIANSYPRYITSDTPLIVLVDSQVGSAAETLIRLLRNVTNTVFVGVNSSGSSFIGNIVNFELPHSSLAVHFGVSLIAGFDLVNRDGIGFLPDIWVDPEQALEFAVKFANRYYR